MSGELLAKCGCAHCGTHLEFPIEAAGTVISCPNCGVSTELTLDRPLDAGNRVPVGELLAAFNGSIRPPRVSIFYQFGLVLATAVMVLLPVLYLGMIVASAYGVYWYATHFAFLLKLHYSVRLYVIQLVLYVGPVFAGAVLVLFMVKPLFARRAPRAQPLAMNPALEPTLYALIARICDTVGAPMPSRIDLDCELNASAGFRRGAASLLGNDLVLTIGLPLVAGLNLREFAGVMAHEFGHFTQGFGMRFSYVISRINFWFIRVIYLRDAWDLWLDQWAEEADAASVMFVVTCARISVWFSRVLLKILMYFGHGVCCFLLRQMEYHADACEIRLVGSATFESSTRRLAALADAARRAYKEVRATWNLNRRLPDDFPRFLVRMEARTVPAHRERLQDTLGLTRTGLFHTHPSAGDRIRAARRANEPGIFHLEQPAEVLFSHFDVVAKQVTHLHYTEDHGLMFDSTNLRPVESN